MAYGDYSGQFNPPQTRSMDWTFMGKGGQGGQYDNYWVPTQGQGWYTGGGQVMQVPSSPAPKMPTLSYGGNQTANGPLDGLLDKLLGPGAGQRQLGGGMGGLGQYNQNVDAGPIWGQQQTQQAAGGIGQTGQAMASSHPLAGNQLRQAVGQETQGNQLEFERSAALRNATEGLRSEQQRAQLGLQHAGFLADRNASAVNNQDFYQNAILRLLGSLVNV